jgi:outer membrane protein assembly factor BamD
MTVRWYGIGFASLCILLTSCATTSKFEKMKIDCTNRVTKALEQYRLKKYSSALVRLEDARTQCSGSLIMDTVLFYLGMSNVKTKKYVEARTEFQRLTQDFPGSPFFDEAKFRIGYTVFKQSGPYNRDQKETREAIRLFDDYIETYPKSTFVDSAVFYRGEAFEKLATKEFKNARFYEKVNEPDAAVVYYRTFISQYADSKLADQARFNALSILMKQGRTSEARDLLTELLEKGRDKELQKQAKALFAPGRKGAAAPEKK